MQLPQRFWDKVNKTDSCWLWIAGKVDGSYGRFRFGKKMYLAHVLSYTNAKRKRICRACDRLRSSRKKLRKKAKKLHEGPALVQS